MSRKDWLIMFSQSFFTHFDRCTNGNPSFLLSFEKTCGTLKSGIEVKQNALRYTMSEKRTTKGNAETLA